MSTQKSSIWKKYFLGKEGLINFLIIAIPAIVFIGMLQLLWMDNPYIEIFFIPYIAIFILGALTYITGLIREKSLNREDKIVNLSIFIFSVFVASLILIKFDSKIENEYESDINYTKTDKNEIFSEQKDNLYRNTKYNFSIKFPEDWKIKPGDSPNTLKQAVKYNSYVGVGIREFSKEYDLEKNTIKDLMTLEEFKKYAPDQQLPNAKILDYGETSLDNKPAYWVKYSITCSISNKRLNAIFLQYLILNKNIFYVISTGTGTSTEGYEFDLLEKEFNLMKKEFDQSVSTFVIEDYN